MLTQSQVLQMQDRVTQTLAQAGIVLTPQEQAQ
ncbi:MAG: D-lyxose/D-mannose family sugar isomerase, partial [Chloroflexi bacterium]